MSAEFELNAELRTDLGKGASRRLRRLQNKVPAVLYGADKDPQAISLKANELDKALLNEAFYSHILTINLDGKAEQAVIKDLQRHPAKPIILHADFQRIDATHEIHMSVPLHYMNEEKCKGVKLQGGKISHQMTEVEITCLAKDLPEYLEVDMTEVEVGTILHLSDIGLPEGVRIIALTQGDDHDLPIATVQTPKGGSDEDEGDAAAEGSAEEGESDS